MVLGLVATGRCNWQSPLPLQLAIAPHITQPSSVSAWEPSLLHHITTHLGSCIIDSCNQLPRNHCILLLHHNAQYGAFTGRFDVDRDFVCFNLCNRLILCNCIPRLLQDSCNGTCRLQMQRSKQSIGLSVHTYGLQSQLSR